MATTSRTKDSALGKEKRGTTTSNSLTVNQRSGSRSTTDKEKSSQTEKHIPNYLKPTISSRHEPLKLSKKNSPEDNINILRRRSFDRPPSSSPRGQKALISPARRDRSSGTPPAPTVPRERKLTARSSSFSGKTVVLPKPVLDNRTSKTPKAVKSQPFFSKTAKKGSTSSLNRKECNASTSSKVSNHDSPDTLDHETEQEEKEIVKEESQPEVNSYVTKSENGEEVIDDVDNTDLINNGEVEKMNIPSDISSRSEDQNVLQVEENAETALVKTDTQREESRENLSKDESCDISPEEIVAEEVNAKMLADVEEKGEDHKNENVEKGDENKIEGKDKRGEEETGSEGVKEKEGQELEGESEEGKQGDHKAANAVSKIQGGGQGGKKESPTAYNDVIEETASKLLEKRKNKVRALVGAFETVIDYQSGGSK